MNLKNLNYFFLVLIFGILLSVNTNLYELVIIFIYIVFFLIYLSNGLKTGLLFILFALIPFSAFLWRLELVYANSLGNLNVMLFFPDILFFIVLIVFIFKIFNKEIKLSPTPISGILFAFIIYCALQILNPSTNLYSGVSGFRYILFLSIFFVTVNLNIDYKDLDQIIQTIIVLAIILAIYAIMQNIFGLPWFEKKWISKFWTTSNQIDFNNINQQGSYFFNKTIRAYSFTEQGPYLAQFLSFVISIVLVSIRGEHNKIKNVLLSLLILFLFYTIIISYSRGAIIAVSLAIILIFIIKKTGKINVLTFGYLIIVLLIFILFISPFMLENISPTTAGEYGLLQIFNPSKAGSLEGRFFFWNFILKNILSNPLGYGTGSAGTAAIGRSPLLDVITDNQYLGIALQYGFIGLTLYLLIIYKIFKSLITTFNNSSNIIQKNLALSMFGSSIVYFIYGFVADNLEQRLPTYFYWFLLGLTFRIIKDQNIIKSKNK